MHDKRRSIEVSLKSRRNGGWTIAMLSGPAVQSEALVSLAVDDGAAAGVSARRFIAIGLGRKVFVQVSLFCVTAAQQRAVIEVFGEAADRGLKLRLMAVPQAVAALLLICLQPSILLPGASARRFGGRRNLRKRLAMAAIKLGPRISYAAWQRRFDCWVTTAAGKPLAVPIMALVFTGGAQNRAALEASLGSIDAAAKASSVAVAVEIIDCSADDPAARLRTALDAATAAFVIVLQAGEVIAPHAIAALVRFAEKKQLAIVYADEDRIDFSGLRSEPFFKPEASRMLMLSGLLASGIFLLRRDVLAGFSSAAAGCADALRLDAWLRMRARAMAGGNAQFSGRVPLILTHRRPDTAAPPPELLASIARADLGSAWTGEIDATRLPLRMHPGVAAPAPKVSLIVPSTGRLAHVRGCLLAILQQTNYPDFEMIIVLSQAAPLDAAQQENLAPVLADARVRVVFAPGPKFNYSRANNLAVQHSAAPLICLLNDDVSPIATDWLRVMVGHLQDQHIAAVGAKLYYPDATVQHGGVIMGLSGLCDHAFRLLPRDAAGYAARASLEQEVAAVTAACMLIRKPVFAALGGLDERFASAYNDVDLCLRIREAGHGIVWSAQAELWHHETVSFGKHYADGDKPLAERDIAMMRERWSGWCAADPFHNPNLSLEMQSEWELAFPPRLGGLPAALELTACGGTGDGRASA
jgi:GT2 family glycosyltransferase